ncbi:MAG: hypothetical protein H6737_28650 [Alphaproteobacteria bacterium]|nr:hypothetical protein [Alphaproteobacteria bacterium]
MRNAFPVLLLAAACVDPAPQSGSDAGLRRDGEGIALEMQCIDEGCVYVEMVLIGELPVPPRWWVDGEVVDAPDRLPLDLADGDSLRVDVQVGDSFESSAVVTRFAPDPIDASFLPDPETVVVEVLGDDCRFEIVAVGGCVISAPELRFGTPGRPPVRFKTGSWQTLGLLQLGFARAAWWGANGFYTNYGIPANARNNQWNEVAAWIETAPGQTYPLYAEHRTDRSVPYQIATAVCSEDGKGSVTYPTN